LRFERRQKANSNREAKMRFGLLSVLMLAMGGLAILTLSLLGLG
jgi:hypothetical protein